MCVTVGLFKRSQDSKVQGVIEGKKCCHIKVQKVERLKGGRKGGLLNVTASSTEVVQLETISR